MAKINVEWQSLGAFELSGHKKGLKILAFWRISTNILLSSFSSLGFISSRLWLRTILPIILGFLAFPSDTFTRLFLDMLLKRNRILTSTRFWFNLPLDPKGFLHSRYSFRRSSDSNPIAIYLNGLFVKLFQYNRQIFLSLDLKYILTVTKFELLFSCRHKVIKHFSIIKHFS